MCGVSVRGNRPGSHKGVYWEPGAAGKPPLPNGKMACQQLSERAASDDRQLWSGDACGADALTCPLQPAARTATSATTTARARRTRMLPRYLPHLGWTLEEALAEIGRSRGTISGGYGLERAHLIGAGMDHAGRGLGHFVPGTGEVAERFRDHQPSLLTDALQDLHLGV